ncbi:MAG: DMT family transporter [Pseudomonadota bacterium]
MRRNTIPSHRNAILLIIAATVLWSSTGFSVRQLTIKNGYEITFWRSMFSALFVAILLLRQPLKTTFKTIHKAGKTGMISAVMWGTNFSCFTIALSMTTIANVLIICGLSSLFTGLFAWLFLKQSIKLSTWIAIVVASIGIIAMFFSDLSLISNSKQFIGVIIALIIPLAMSINYIALQKSDSQVDLIPSVMLGCIFSSIAMLPLVWPIHINTHDLLIAGSLGMFQLGLPAVMTVIAARKLSAPEISLWSLIEIVLGFLWGWLGSGETPSTKTIIGGTLVLIALAFNEMAAICQKRQISHSAADNPPLHSPTLLKTEV